MRNKGYFNLVAVDSESSSVAPRGMDEGGDLEITTNGMRGGFDPFPN